MVDVSVRQNNTVDLSDWNGKGSVFLRGIAAFPLKHSTIEKNCAAIYSQNVTGSGDLTGRAIKFNFQKLLTPLRPRYAETGLSPADHVVTSMRVPTRLGFAR